MNAPTCPSNSWVTSRLRELIVPLAPLSISASITRPVAVRTTFGQGYKSQKAYIVSLFVCLTTKALHLELVSDYTSPTFIAAICFSPRIVDIHVLRTGNHVSRRRSRTVKRTCKGRSILTSATDSQSTELRGTSYPLRHRTAAACGRPVLKVSSII